MKAALYVLCQCTWGFLQTLLGALLFILHLGDKHFTHHGAIVTQWGNKGSISLGLFLFLTEDPAFYKGLARHGSREEVAARLLAHEYGHAVQSLILGPLYLPIIGIPSALWANLPDLRRRRREKRISYYSLYTEKWANRLGEKVLKRKAMETLDME